MSLDIVGCHFTLFLFLLILWMTSNNWWYSSCIRTRTSFMVSRFHHLFLGCITVKVFKSGTTPSSLVDADNLQGKIVTCFWTRKFDVIWTCFNLSSTAYGRLLPHLKWRPSPCHHSCFGKSVLNPYILLYGSNSTILSNVLVWSNVPFTASSYVVLFVQR